VRRYEGQVKNQVKGCPVPQSGTGRYKVKGEGAQLKSLCGKGKTCTSAAEAALILLCLRRGWSHDLQKLPSCHTDSEAGRYNVNS